MTVLVATSVVRGTRKGDSHGGIYLIDLEGQRQKTTVTLTLAQAEVFLETAPFMPGAAYLTPEVLQGIWTQLNTTFQMQIKAHEGTVALFIQTLSAKVHLVGRVFFHLVESKKEAYPFAFMATYSTGLNTQGESRHLPLKHALSEFGAQSHRLLDLPPKLTVATNRQAPNL